MDGKISIEGWKDKYRWIVREIINGEITDRSNGWIDRWINGWIDGWIVVVVIVHRDRHIRELNIG